MKPRQIVRITTDVLMTLLLLFLMGYHFWGDTAHEWAGAGIFLLFFLHHILNWGWWKNLFKGRYSAVRIFQTVIDILTLFSMLGLIVSSVVLSRDVFAFLPIKGSLAFARVLHMVSAYWGFLMMAAHLGLHWGIMIGAIRKGKNASPKVFPSVLPGAAVALYGIIAFFRRRLPDYLFLQTEFVFLDFSESKILFYLDYLAMMGTFIFLTHYAVKLLRRRKKDKSL